MKAYISISVISIFLVNSSIAFCPSGLRSIPHTSKFLKATTTENDASVEKINKVLPKEDMLKEDAASAGSEEGKWKVKENAKEQTQVEKMEVQEEVIPPKITDPKLRVQTNRYKDLEMSLSIPFLKRPNNLDGTHAGDIGFDPLGFTESNDLYTMMEAEIRHSRLAMLAVVGWPLSELLGPKFMLQGENHIAPSVLNGFNPLSALVTLLVFGGIGYFEYSTALRSQANSGLGRKHAEDMADVWKYGIPGDYNFDPLNLYSSFGDDAAGRKAMREVEVAHGRAAMLGISYFALWESMTGIPIVKNNLLFEPNLIIPLLGVAYLGFDFFFDMESDDQYLFQIKLSSEGDMRVTRLQNWLNSSLRNSGVDGEVLKEKGGAITDFADMIKSKVGELTKEEEPPKGL